MSQLPTSSLIKQATFVDPASERRKTKDEYRKQKDLEEQRKAGTAPAMVDVETGRDINPHIPEFIERTPWYVPSSGPTLKHQRPHPEREQIFATINEWYPKGPSGRVAFKYRDGSCENCGAMGHKKKECFERPRLVGAKYTNSNIAPDDQILPKLNMGYDAKRDRWGGYDPTEYNQQVGSEFEKMDEARRLIRAQKMDGGAVDEDVDEDIYADDMAPGQSVDMDSRTRITVRNLRIREDTAKYLYNLNENSAYYDPKSRSMRENPYENMPGKEKEAAKFAGENFIQYTGEVTDANEAQVFAWQARCKGIDIHSLAEPTRLELLKKEYETEKVAKKSEHKNELLDKYGGQEYLESLPNELLYSQTESYVEYNRKGKVIKGLEKVPVRSRYPEDIYINNHTSVFGSYWEDGKWGYKCCHSFVRNSYCVGEFISTSKVLPKIDPIPNIDCPGPNNLEDEANLIPSTSKNNGTDEPVGTTVPANAIFNDSSDRSGTDSEGEDDIKERKERLRQEIEKKKRDDRKRELRREKRHRRKEQMKKRTEEDGRENTKKRQRMDKDGSPAFSPNSDDTPREYSPSENDNE